MRTRWVVACAAFLTTNACGNKTATSTAYTVSAAMGPTLLVTNATCTPGPCMRFQVRGDASLLVPGDPPSGFMLIGSVDSASACLRFPTSWTIGRDSTLWTVWTVSDHMWLVASTGSGALPLGYTTDFVPGSSPGWRVTLPSGFGSAAPVPVEPCTP